MDNQPYDIPRGVEFDRWHAAAAGVGPAAGELDDKLAQSLVDFLSLIATRTHTDDAIKFSPKLRFPFPPSTELTTRIRSQATGEHSPKSETNVSTNTTA